MRRAEAADNNKVVTVYLSLKKKSEFTAFFLYSKCPLDSQLVRYEFTVSISKKLAPYLNCSYRTIAVF